MWALIACGGASLVLILAILTAVVFEIRRLHADVHKIKKDVLVLNEEAGLTTISQFSVHGVPEMNRWPVAPRLSWWGRFVAWWRKLVSL
jgi:hypothetical protein